MATYTHIVAKHQRGMDGQWFRYSGRGYASADEAIEAARDFAEEQCAAGVVGTEIRVADRKRKAVATFRWPDGCVKMVDWRE